MLWSGLTFSLANVADLSETSRRDDHITSTCRRLSETSPRDISEKTYDVRGRVRKKQPPDKTGLCRLLDHVDVDEQQRQQKIAGRNMTKCSQTFWLDKQTDK